MVPWILLTWNWWFLTLLLTCCNGISTIDPWWICLFFTFSCDIFLLIARQVKINSTFISEKTIEDIWYLKYFKAVPIVGYNEGTRVSYREECCSSRNRCSTAKKRDLFFICNMMTRSEVAILPVDTPAERGLSLSMQLNIFRREK